LAATALLLGVALPGYRSELQRAGRADAVHALTALQAAQERFRAAHGLYADRLAALALPARSVQGRYRIALEAAGVEAYRARATALGAQSDDSACAVLTLEVDAGFARSGPHARCWNR
ncbi:MAG: pilus assembly protein PilE, partial [Comamonadaceae bacterium]|nr:pilus assembly protein PilE [Comamonadaceae bacterium]